mmetsp:Transcript_24301/g.83063  ORF Transcript_24301/g.83063 Transcript_24301/m.83063 type:complete len:355 (-) Transcript_24301:97-1161(-)
MASRSTTAQRYAVDTACGAAFVYPPCWMGMANWAWNTGKVPSLPGLTKSNRDQSSVSRFWIGAPLITTRCLVRHCFATSVTSASGLRILWPSSSTTYPQRMGRSSSCASRRPSYVVTTTPPPFPFASSSPRRRASFRLPVPLPASALSCRITTWKGGYHFSSSLRHCLSIVAGHTTRETEKRPLWCRPARNAATCTVLPRPISSASTQFTPCSYRSARNFRPSSWYSRRHPRTASGCVSAALLAWPPPDLLGAPAARVAATCSRCATAGVMNPPSAFRCRPRKASPRLRASAAASATTLFAARRCSTSGLGFAGTFGFLRSMRFSVSSAFFAASVRQRALSSASYTDISPDSRS